jgi:hypothetical protein
MGLFDVADRSVKRAGRAYAATREWMLGAVMGGCSEDRDVWVCELKDADKRTARLVWRQVDNELRWSVPSGWGAKTVETLDGETLHLSSPENTIPLGESPVLIR